MAMAGHGLMNPRAEVGSGGSSTHIWLLQEVGYFQGMNEVVAVLLMFLNEDDTFWRLFQLMTDAKHVMRSRCLLRTAGQA